MRALVTGSAGMLGRDLVPLLSAGETRALTRADADLTDAAALERAAAGFDPEVVFHLAAWTDVDGCERDPDRAERENAGATRNVAELAGACGALVVLVSTDYVFDGRATRPIRPDELPRPISAYGRSKLHAEEALRDSGAAGLVVRTSWLIGPHGRNFIEAIRTRARRGEPLRVVDDQRGSPTFTFDLAPALVRLGRSRETGVLHLANAGECTWYELAREVLRKEGSETSIVPISSEEIDRPAPRPRYSVLDTTAAEAILGSPLPSWRDSLARYLRERPATVA